MKLKVLISLPAIKQSVISTNQSIKSGFEKVNKEIINCSPGCNHCCHRKIYVTLAEALLIVDHCRKKGILSTVLDISKQQESWVSNTDVDTYFRMKIPCPLLNQNTGRCNAYNVRPPVCAAHFVISSPEACDAWSTKLRKYVDFTASDEYAQYETISKSKINPALLIKLPIQVALIAASKLSDREYESLDQLINAISKDPI